MGRRSSSRGRWTDVYKRQGVGHGGLHVEDGAVWGNGVVFSRFHFVGVVAVSYTHLDVYKRQGIESLEKGRTSYTPNRGFLKLRAEISNFIERHYHVKYDPQDEVLVTVGGSEAIDLCVRTLVEPGDEVLIPEPSFVCYVPITEMAGGVDVYKRQPGGWAPAGRALPAGAAARPLSAWG